LDFEIKLKDGTSVPRFVTSYIIESQNRLLLVDTALKQSASTIFGYIDSIGRKPIEIETVINTHSHFDHIGGNQIFLEETRPQFYAHGLEVPFIEDIALQHRERPVGAMVENVAGSVFVNKTIGEGDTIIHAELEIQVFHTPGHSSGSISLFIPEDGVFICGDVLPEEGTLPIYEDVDATLSSLEKIKKMERINTLLSSLSRKVSRGQNVIGHLNSGENYLEKIQGLADKFKSEKKESVPVKEMAELIFKELTLPESGIMPIVLTSISAHCKD